VKRSTSTLAAAAVALVLGSGAAVVLRADAQPLPGAAPPPTGRYQLVQHWPAASRYLHVYLLDTATGALWMPVQERTGQVRWHPMQRSEATDEPGGADDLGDALPLSGLPEDDVEVDEEAAPPGWLMAAQHSMPQWAMMGALGECVRQCLSGDGLEPLDLK